MADLDYAKVVGRFALTAGDTTSDVDDDPDTIWCDEGRVIITPLTTYAKVAGGIPEPFTVGNAQIEATIDSEGYLTYLGKRHVHVVDLTSPKVNPRIGDGFATHRVTFNSIRAQGTPVAFPEVLVRLTAAGDANGENDLTLVMPVAAGEATAIVQGPKGTGVETMAVQGGDLVVTLDDGAVVNAGALPVGPGGSDEGVASYITTPGTATESALSASYAPAAAPAPVMALSTDGGTNRNASAVLRRFWSRLLDAPNAPVAVAAIGDSIVEGGGATSWGGRWVSVMQAALRERFSLGGGRGFIGPFATNGTWAGFTWPTTTTGNPPAFGATEYGPKRGTAILSGTTYTYHLVGTHAQIVYPVAPSFGTIHYSVDGGATVDINAVNAVEMDGQITDIPLGASGSHTLTISGTGSAYFDGVIEYDGDTAHGVRVHDCGHGGWLSSDFNGGSADPTSRWPAAIDALGPDLLLVAIGVNDVAQGLDVATYEANMAGYLADLRAKFTWQPIVFVAYPAVENQAAAWPAYVEAMKALADTDGNALVADLTAVLDGRDGDALGMWHDANHPNDLGHRLIGQYVAGFLMPPGGPGLGAGQAPVALALQNGWGNYGSGMVEAAAHIDALGYVHLDGLVAGGNTAGGTTLCVLPPGYRPAATVWRASTSEDQIASLYITPAGEVKLNKGTAGWVSLAVAPFAPA